MATFRAYAKVLEPDDPTMRIYEAGLRACPGEPGMPLAEVLRRSGGVYQTTTPLIPHMRDDIREVAELTSDAELLKIAELTEVPVSLEHLRGLDPQTRIIIRSELSYEGDEASQVSAATRPRHALATVMPDGTVIPGDVRPLGRLDPHPPGDRSLGQVTTSVARHKQSHINRTGYRVNQPAGQRGRGEAGEADQEGPAAAVLVAQPPAGDQQHSQGQRVAGAQPLDQARTAVPCFARWPDAGL
jgi:hypothetical protein